MGVEESESRSKVGEGSLTTYCELVRFYFLSIWDVQGGVSHVVMWTKPRKRFHHEEMQ